MPTSTTPQKKRSSTTTRTTAPTMVDLWGGALRVRAGAIHDIKTLRISDRSGDLSNQKETGLAVFSHDSDIADLGALPTHIFDKTAKATKDRAALGIVTVRCSDLPAPGAERAQIGYAYVSVGSSTLWLFILDSAAKANLPSLQGDLSGIGRNAFTEMVIGAAVTLYLAGSRTLALRFAFWSRYDRSEVFSSRIRQVVRSNPGMSLWAEGKKVDLHSAGGQVTSAVEGGVSHSQMVTTKEAMFIGRVNKLRANLWDRGEGVLPFGYRFDTEQFGNGPVLRRKGVIVPDVAQREVLGELVQMAADGVAWHTIGRRAAKLGVALRSPRLVKMGATFADLPDIDSSLAAAATTLLANPEHIGLWRTGAWAVRRMSPLPGVTSIREYDLEFEDGAQVGHIDTQVTWTLPEGGWGIADNVWDKLLARLGAAKRRPRGSGGSDADRRPLSGMGDWTEGDWQYRLAPETSTAYRLRRRSVESGHFADGRARGWNTAEGDALGTFYAPSLHRDVSRALEGALVHLVQGGTELGALPVAPRQAMRLTLDREDRATALAGEAHELEERAEALDSMAIEAKLAGNDLSASSYIDKAEAARAGAATMTQAAETLRFAEPEGPTEAEEPVELDLANPAVVAGALRRYGQQAPAVLAAAVAALGITESFRIHLNECGDLATWTATCDVPLADCQGAVAVELTGTVPNTRGVPGADGTTKRRPQVVSDDVLRLLLVENLPMAEVARAIGATEHWTRTRATRAIQEHGVRARNLRFAILDCPVPETRRVVFAHCVGDDGLVRDLDPTFIDHVVAVYFGDAGWGAKSWTSNPWRFERRLMATLLAAPGGQATTKHLTAALGVAPRQLAQRVKPGRRRLGLVSHASHVVLRPVPCPHTDCAASDGSASHILPTPETASGLLCPDCQRLPDNAVVVFPAGYLEFWEGPGDGTVAPTTLASNPPTAAVLAEEAMLTVGQAAEALGCSDYQVRTRLDPDERQGKVRLYRPATVEAKRQELTRGADTLPVQLTIGQVAKRLGVQEWRVRKLVDRGAVTCERHYGWRYLVEDDVPTIGSMLTAADTDPTLLGIGAAAGRIGTTTFLLRKAADEGDIDCSLTSGGTRKFTEEAVAIYAAARGGEVTTAGAARLLGVSTDTVRSLEVRGLLLPSSITSGGHRRFTKVAVNAYVATRDALAIVDT